MIGYGPDVTDDKGAVNNHDDHDFHPLPPPITKGMNALIPLAGLLY